MKLIVAVVQPFKVPEIVDWATHRADFPGITVLEARGFGREKVRPHMHSTREDVTDFQDARVPIVASPEAGYRTVRDGIAAIARTGMDGDGKVFVVDLLDAVRVSTGGVGDEALA